MIIAAAVAAAGTVVGGLQAKAQGKYEARVAGMNASLATEQMRESITKGKQEARQFWREGGRIKGEQIAAMAANGIDVGFGSALRLQEDTALVLAEDADNLYRNIHDRTRGYEIDFLNQKAEQAAAKARGNNALVRAGFEAASTLASSFAQHSALKRKITPMGQSGGYG